MLLNEIKQVLEGVYNNFELRKTIVPLFMSKPGQGKSNIIEDFMREKGVWKPPFVLSQRMPFEISGMALVDKEINKMKYYDFDFILELKDGDILFIDEVTNANPVTLNAFLTFLEARVMVSGRKLPNIMIVGAGNYEGIMPLTPQIKERFVWYDVNFDKNMWIDFMMTKYNITKVIGDKLSNLIQKETFTGNNFNTPRSIDKAVNMIISKVNTPYQELIKPILSELIKNPFEQAVDLGNNKILEVNEMISWLDLIRLKIK